MGVKVSKTYKITEPITLESLRTLVNATSDADGKTRVDVKEHKSHSPVDFDAASITVTYEVDS